MWIFYWQTFASIWYTSWKNGKLWKTCKETEHRHCWNAKWKSIFNQNKHEKKPSPNTFVSAKVIQHQDRHGELKELQALGKEQSILHILRKYWGCAGIEVETVSCPSCTIHDHWMVQQTLENDKRNKQQNNPLSKEVQVDSSHRQMASSPFPRTLK